MKNKNLNKWFIVKVDKNVKCNEFKGLCDRFESLKNGGYDRWYEGWKRMMLLNKNYSSLNVEFCLMKGKDMWWLKNWFNNL